VGRVRAVRRAKVRNFPIYHIPPTDLIAQARLTLCFFQSGNVGYPSRVLRPAKGLHSVDQAYVEYDGKVTDTDELVDWIV
jgi:hypothetical protein